MKRQHRLFCRDNRQCAEGFSCLGGECKEDIVPDPPFAGDSPEAETPKEDEG